MLDGKVLVSDGAWGTMLFNKGAQFGECLELWNVEHRDDVLDIGRSYIEADASSSSSKVVMQSSHSSLSESCSQ